MKFSSSNNNFIFLFSYALKETVKRKGYFILCFLSCVTITIVSLVSKTFIEQGPLVYAIVKESQIGEKDIIIKPSAPFTPDKYTIEDYQIFYGHLNYTKFMVEVNKNNYFELLQSTPRIKFQGHSNLQKLTNSKHLQQQKIEFSLIDSKQENKIGLGRAFNYPNLNKGECYVHQTALNNLNKEDGYIHLQVYLQEIVANSLIDLYYLSKLHKHNKNVEKIKDWHMQYVAYFKCKYISIDKNYGKDPESWENTVYMDIESFFEYIADHLSDPIKLNFPDYLEIFKTLKPKEYSNEIIVNFEHPRLNAYKTSNYDELLHKTVSIANKIVYLLDNNDHINISIPLVHSMRYAIYMSLILGLILNIIIIILFVLSIVLIYSLLLITVETSVFEYGIIRTLGTTKIGIIIIIFFQCFAFSIPAFLIAYGLHFPFIMLINTIIKAITYSEVKLEVSIYALIFSFLICNLAPLISALIPINKILTADLATSINTTANKASGVHIEISSTSKKEAVTLVICGFITFVYGISIYYFLPLSLLTLNPSLMLIILLWILMGLLLGLIILSMNLEAIMQKIMIIFLFFWAAYGTKLLIFKNLTAHRLKNRTTSIIFALSIGFLIMLTVSMDMQKQVINNSYNTNNNYKPRFLQDHKYLNEIYKESLNFEYSGIIESLVYNFFDLDNILRSKNKKDNKHIFADILLSDNKNRKQIQYQQNLYEYENNKLENFISKQYLELDNKNTDDHSHRKLLSDRSKENINQILSLLNLIFYGVGALVLNYCFFNVTATMTINIYEQRKEIAILRSLGLTTAKIIFIYVAEAITLIAAASFLGLIIGLILSYGINKQLTVFIKTEVHFVFPYLQLIIVLIISFIIGFLATFFSIKKILKQQISIIARN